MDQRNAHKNVPLEKFSGDDGNTALSLIRLTGCLMGAAIGHFSAEL
jgi:hydroxyethylthiazole kinase-like sugar kinase family protein